MPAYEPRRPLLGNPLARAVRSDPGGAVRFRHKPVVKISNCVLLVEGLVVESCAQVAEDTAASHSGRLVVFPPL